MSSQCGCLHWLGMAIIQGGYQYSSCNDSANVEESRQFTKILEFRAEIEPLGIFGTYRDVRGSKDGFFEKVE